MRDYGIVELRRTLRRSGHAQGDIEEAIARLVAARYLNDQRYATTYARSRITTHGLGRNKVRANLRRRGLARETIEKGLAEALEHGAEREALRAAAERLLRQHARKPPRQRVQRVFQTLLRRGFPPDLVREGLGMLEPRWRDMLDDHGFPAFDAIDEGHEESAEEDSAERGDESE